MDWIPLHPLNESQSRVGDLLRFRAKFKLPCKAEYIQAGIWKEIHQINASAHPPGVIFPYLVDLSLSHETLNIKKVFGEYFLIFSTLKRPHYSGLQVRKSERDDRESKSNAAATFTELEIESCGFI